MPTILLATEHGVLLDGRLVLAGDARGVVAGQDRWIAVVDGAVHVSSDQERWQRLAGDLDHAATTVAEVATGDLLVGTEGAHLYLVDGDARVDELEAFRAVPTVSAWHTPRGGPPAVRSIAVTPAGAWLVNVHVGGIIRSADAGATWSPTIDLHTDVHEIVAVGQHAFAALGAGGLASSADAGITWRTETEGLAATYCRAVGVAGDRVLVSSSRGPSGGSTAVYARPVDEVAPLVRVPLPADLPGNVDTGCLATRGTSVAVGTEDGRLFSSDDAGRTWQQGLEVEGAIRGVTW